MWEIGETYIKDIEIFCLNKVYRVKLLVFSVNAVVVFVKVQLIHAEYDRNILGLPLFLVGVLVVHARPLHNAAAFGIFDIVCGGDVGNVQ